MKLNTGLPYSLIRYGLPHAYPKLLANVATDVLIVGGGISGALMAYHLVKAGIRCIVADKRTIGLGSTSASTSLLQYEIDISLSELIKIAGEETATRAYLLSNEAIHSLEKISRAVGFDGFVSTESLYYAAAKKDEKKLTLEYTARKKAGLAVEYLPAQQLKRKFSISAPGAILSKNAAFADAYLFTHALFQHCLKKGAMVFDRTNIAAVNFKHTGIEAITDENAKIKAKHIIYATGYETTEFIKKKIVDLRSTYVTVSETISGCEQLPFSKTLLWNTADPYLYMRCTTDGRIIVGGRDDKSSSPATRDKQINKKSKALVRDFRKLFPSIDFKSEFNWAGTFGTTKDGLPYIGNYDSHKNKHFALGFGGNGIVFSQIAAEIVRDSILGRKNSNESMFQFDR